MINFNLPNKNKIQNNFSINFRRNSEISLLVESNFFFFLSIVSSCVYNMFVFDAMTDMKLNRSNDFDV